MIRQKFFLFVVLLAAVLGGVFYVVLGRGARQDLIQQLLHREQVIARSGGSSIGYFFYSFGRSLSALAKDERIIEGSEGAKERMETFVQAWKSDYMAGLIWVDDRGNVVFNANTSGSPDIGSDMSDRDYFTWAKNNPPQTDQDWDTFVGSAVIGRLGVSKGKMIVPLAVPIYSGKEFRGVLAASILIDNLSKEFLDPLKISESSEIYLLKQDGAILSSPFESLTGRNIFDLMDENPFLGDRILRGMVEKNLSGGQEGKIHTAVPDFTNSGLREMLIAYSPVQFDDQKWMLAIATPVKDALVFVGPFYIRQLGVILLTFLLVLAFAIVLSRRLGHFQAHLEDKKIPTAEKPRTS